MRSEKQRKAKKTPERNVSLTVNLGSSFYFEVLHILLNFLSMCKSVLHWCLFKKEILTHKDAT